LVDNNLSGNKAAREEQFTFKAIDRKRDMEMVTNVKLQVHRINYYGKLQ
jgi:hypothetical protein